MTYHVEFDIDFKRNNLPGCLIAVEGIDGSGKTTQVEHLVEELRKTQKVFVTKNPTDGEIGQVIRRVLKGDMDIPKESFQFLFSADRQVQQKEILQHLQNDEVVVTDRYFWSAIAYGMVDRGIDNAKETEILMVAQGILSMYHQFIIPDVTFYLDISVDTAMKRLSQMDKEKELYEQKGQLKKIEGAYKWLINKFPEEITIINGERSAEEISREMIQRTSEKIGRQL